MPGPNFRPADALDVFFAGFWPFWERSITTNESVVPRPKCGRLLSVAVVRSKVQTPLDPVFILACRHQALKRVGHFCPHWNTIAA